LRRWNWIEGLVLPLAVALMLAAWVALWLRWSARGVAPDHAVPAVPPAALALLLLAGWALTRRVLRRGPASPRARLGLAGAGLAAAFLTAWWNFGLLTPMEFLRRLVDWDGLISPVFISLAACALMWQQGILLGRSPTPQEHLERVFFGGLAALGLLFAINQARPLLRPAETLGGALIFFAAGLGALALLSVESARRRQSGTQAARPALNRYWLGTVAGVIGLILLGGLLVEALFSPGYFDRLERLLAAVADALLIAFIAIVALIVVAAAWLLNPLLEQLALALGNSPLRIPTLPEVVEQAPETVALLERYPALNFARQGLTLLLIAAMLGLVLWLAVRRFIGLGRSDVDEQRESIASRQLLLAQLRALLRQRRGVRSADSPYLDLNGPPDDPRLIIRRAYQALLAWTRAFGLPRRHAGQTPAAYARTLSEYFPERASAVERLTSLYARARYAGQPPTLAEARLAQAALAELRARPEP
jgi:hypothetical protein